MKAVSTTTETSDSQCKMQNERNTPREHRTCFWSRESEYLRNEYLVNNPLPFCEYCKTPGHPEKTCRSKSHNTANSTTDSNTHNQTTSRPQPLFPNNYGFQNHTQRQGQVHQNHNFRSSTNKPNQQRPSNNNNNNKKIPANQKYCFRFAAGMPCNKPPCMFLHECEGCGENHGTNYCDKFSSTPFFPQF